MFPRFTISDKEGSDMIDDECIVVPLNAILKDLRTGRIVNVREEYCHHNFEVETVEEVIQRVTLLWYEEDFSCDCQRAHYFQPPTTSFDEILEGMYAPCTGCKRYILLRFILGKLSYPCEHGVKSGDMNRRYRKCIRKYLKRNATILNLNTTAQSN